MKPDRARKLAEECRMTAGILFAIAIASALAALGVWYSLGAGILLLACIVVATVCAVGFLHEMAEASRLDRQARDWFPRSYENHGHE